MLKGRGPKGTDESGSVQQVAGREARSDVDEFEYESILTILIP